MQPTASRAWLLVTLGCLLFTSPFAEAISLGKSESLLSDYRAKPSPRLKKRLTEAAFELLEEGLTDQAQTWRKQEALLEGGELAVEIANVVHGEGSAQAAGAAYDLSRIYGRFGWPTEQERMLVKAYRLRSAQVGSDDPGLGWIKLVLARLRLPNGVEQARPLIDDALATFENTVGTSHFLYFEARKTLASSILSYGRADEARRIAEETLASLVTERDYSHAIEFDLRSIIASSLSAELKTQEAIAYAERSLERLRTLDDYRSVTPCSAEDREPIAFPLRLPSVAECNELIDSQRASLHHDLVDLNLLADRIDEARDHVRKAVGRSSRDQVRLLQYAIDGEFDRMLRQIDRSMPLLVRTHGRDHPLWADVLMYKAQAHENRGELESATSFYEASIVHRVQSAPTQIVAVANTLQKLGVLYALLGDVERAEATFAQARKAFELLPEVDRFTTNSSLLNQSSVEQAMVYLMLGRYEEAEEIYKRTLATSIEQRGRVHMQTVNAMVQLADFYSGLNYRRRAAELMREAIDLMEAHGSGVSPMNVLRLEGHTAMLEERYGDAVPLLRSAYRQYRDEISADDPMMLLLTFNLAVALNEAGDHDKAADAFGTLITNDALRRQPDHIRAAFETRYSSALLDAGRTKEALKLLENAIGVLTESDNINMIWMAQFGMSRALEADGNIPGAIYFGKQAVNALQSLRGRVGMFSREIQQAFLADKAEVYRFVADLLIETGALGEAQTVLAMLKRHEYSNFTVRGDYPSERSTIPVSRAADSIANNYRSEGKNLVRLRSQIRGLKLKPRLSREEESRLSDLQDEMRESRRAFRDELEVIRHEFAELGVSRVLELGEKNLDSLGQVQATLKRLEHRAALVHYLVLPDRLRILVTTSENRYAYTSNISAGELNRMVFQFREGIEQLADVRAEARTLYRHLITPLEGMLAQENIDSLMISLDSTLRYAPLAAFHDGEDYLIEKLKLSIYTPAGQVALEREPSVRWRVAGFGVSEHEDGFPALPAIRQELDRIVREGADDPIGVLPGIAHIDDEFTLDQLSRVLTDDSEDVYQVIHLASHFSFEPGKESNSFLVAGNGERWTMDDLRYGDFSFHNVDLLTLSACNTGMGGIEADGSEIEGFGALAQNRGAASVIATLWPVADKSTGTFMSRFYELRGKQKKTKVGAMQTVQREFIASADSKDSTQDFSHPFFWAPFILMGNWL